VLISFRDQGRQSWCVHPPKRFQFQAAQRLSTLRQLLDWAGETSLDTNEAARIRSMGLYRPQRPVAMPDCPPEFLVPDLWHLADDIDPVTRPIAWHPKRASRRQISPMDPLSIREHQLIRLIRSALNDRLTRRQLQQGVSRRISTRLLDHMLNRLCVQDDISISGGWIYPFGRAELDALKQPAREQRRPTLLYAS
jgi:hypothetical protein